MQGHAARLGRRGEAHRANHRREPVVDFGFARQLQELGYAADRTLVVGQLAGSQNQDGWFSTQDVNAMFEGFRVPAPKNTAATLGSLANKDLILRRAKQPSWSLTPKGRKTVSELMGDLDAAKLELQLAALPGAEFGHAHQTVLPPSLAPPKWASGIRKLLDRDPFETNVLCMTRFPRDDYANDPIQGVIDVAREVLEGHGLRLHLASDAIVEDTLFANVAAYMWACRYGLALMEDRVGEGLNKNVVIEIGAMVMAGRQTGLLKDTTAEEIPSDLVGHIYMPVDFGDLDTVRRATHGWAAQDLGLS